MRCCLDNSKSSKETYISRTLDIDEQPKSHHLATPQKRTKENSSKSSSLCLRNLLGSLGLNIGGRLDQVVDDGVTVLLAGSLDLLELVLGLLAGIIFGLLESARVLFPIDNGQNMNRRQ